MGKTNSPGYVLDRCSNFHCTNFASKGSNVCTSCVLMNQTLPKHKEVDPLGKSPHESGAKLDAGKVRPGLVLGDFARALWAVSEIGTFGAEKYTDSGWIDVPNAEARYQDAQLRHWLKANMGESNDPDSEKLHLAHEAWNALARLDLYIRNQE